MLCRSPDSNDNFGLSSSCFHLFFQALLMNLNDLLQGLRSRQYMAMLLQGAGCLIRTIIINRPMFHLLPPFVDKYITIFVNLKIVMFSSCYIALLQKLDMWIAHSWNNNLTPIFSLVNMVSRILSKYLNIVFPNTLFNFFVSNLLKNIG